MFNYRGMATRSPFAVCTLWSCGLGLWPIDLMLIGGRGIVMCAKFGDFSFSRFSFFFGQTDTHTYRITDGNDRYTHATTFGVSTDGDENLLRSSSRPINRIILGQSSCDTASKNTVSHWVSIQRSNNNRKHCRILAARHATIYKRRLNKIITVRRQLL